MIVFEENGFYVTLSDQGTIATVFRPSMSGTHAESDSSYEAGPDGLACAVARVLYLSRGPGRHAAEAVRIVAEFHQAAARHGRKMRDAVAAFDSEFLS